LAAHTQERRYNEDSRQDDPASLYGNHGSAASGNKTSPIGLQCGTSRQGESCTDPSLSPGSPHAGPKQLEQEPARALS
jgi:hypothetical protein